MWCWKNGFDLPKKGMTPLHSACLGGNMGVVSLMLTAGAQIEARDEVG
jgi:ankyrin repeat protein